MATRTLALIREYAAADNLAGPQQLLRPVGSHLRYVGQLLSSAEGKSRSDLLFAAARTAEFLGWLYQDAGDLRTARQITDQAYRHSVELGDLHLQAYVLMRQSTIAGDARDAPRASALCEAALQKPANLTPRLKAVLLRQRANAHTLHSDTAKVMASIDQAHEALDKASDADPAAEWTAYVTPGYLDMEAAACWVELGHGENAIDTIERGLAVWQPEFRRDLGICLARAATAYTAVDDADQAHAAAEHALRLVGESQSARTVRELRRAQRAMATRGLTGQAAELDDRLRKVRNAPSEPTGRTLPKP